MSLDQLLEWIPPGGADEALARWRAVAHEGLARVVYEAGAT